MIRSIFFDLDGTLIDSLSDLHRCLNIALLEHGFPGRSRAAIQLYLGDGMPALVQRAAKNASPDQRSAILESYLMEYRKNPVLTTKPYPGIRALLASLRRRYRLSVVTNKNEFFARQILESLGMIPYFDGIIGGDTLPYKKPHPAVLRHALLQSKSAPGNALMIGDHFADLYAAQSARIRTIFCAYGYGRQKSVQADLIVRSAMELGRGIEKLNRKPEGRAAKTIHKVNPLPRRRLA